MMHSIDLIKINFDPNQLQLLNICLAFLMFGVALDISKSDFAYVAKHWKSVLVGLVSQLIFLPILTIILAYVFSPPMSVLAGMVLVSVCPGGNVSNFMVHLAKGNTALSVTLTSIVTISAAVLTPFGFYFWIQFTEASHFLRGEIQISISQIIHTIAILILIPLILGMFFNHYLTDFTKKIKKGVKVLSILIFIGFVVGAIFANFQNILDHVSKVIVLVIIHNGLAILTGFSFARLMGLDLYDTKAVTIETGIQNSGLALIIIFNFYDGLGGMALITACWGIWHLISGGLLTLYWSKS